MAKEPKIWTVTTADGDHVVEFYEGTAFKAARLLIDGQPAVLDLSRSAYEGIDQPILRGGGHDIRIVSKKGFTDLAYDGVYLDSGNNYEPLPKMTKANWIFVIISLAAGFIGGVIPWLVGLGGAAAGSAVAMNRSLDNKKKIILGAILMVATWALAIVLSIVFAKGVRKVEKNVDKIFSKDEYSITLTREFSKDNDTDGFADDGFDLLFAAGSENVYAYAEKITAKRARLAYGWNFESVEDLMCALYDVQPADLKTAANGDKYVIFEENGYYYVLSVADKNDTYYMTEMYCLDEDKAEYGPKMIDWVGSVKIEEAAAAD
ncbi:MAG: hypothetical protein J5586_06835 [Clostridia bacterium]|nr:hypothetical protein [Clostridia bacterium]